MSRMGRQRAKPITDEQIIATYQECRSAYKVAEQLGLGDSTVYRVLVRHGVDRKGLAEYRQRRTRFKGEEQAIRAAYDQGATHDELRRQFGMASDYAIKSAIRRAGGTLRPNPVPRLRPGELEKLRELHATGISQLRIALEIGRSQVWVNRTLRKNGLLSPKRRGELSSQWKGGEYLTGGGYIRVWIPDDDPLAVMRNNSGHVLEHRIVMARALGRPLLPTETVHHVDGDRMHNELSNLQLRQGRHGAGVAIACLDCGSHRIGPVQLT